MADYTQQEIALEGERRRVAAASRAPVYSADQIMAENLRRNPNYEHAQAANAPPPKTDPGLLDMGRISGLIKASKGLWTGDDRREFDLPELPVNIQSGGEVIPIQDKLAVARGNPFAQSGILKNYAPNATQDFDSHGNLTLEYPGGNKYYANRPGASLGDVSEGIVTLATELGMARFGGAAGKKIAGGVGQAIGAAGGLSAGSATEDMIAQQEGSTQPVDIHRIKLLGALGLAGEAIGSFGGRFLDKVLTNSRYVRNGAVTPQGAATLREAGIDPSAVTAEFVEQWGRAARSATDPIAAARSVEASTLPVPVPLSRGDMSRDVSQQAAEDAMLKGARGESAKDTMLSFRQRQQEALRGNLSGAQESIGGQGITHSGEGMGRAQNKIASLRDTMKAEVKAAYDAAQGSGTKIATEGVKQAHAHLKESIKTWNPRTAPQAYGMVKDFGDSVAKKSGYTVSGVKIDALENWLQQVNKLARSADPVEAGAAKTLASNYNQFFETMLDEALVRGEPAAIQAYRTARTLRRQMAKEFESDKLIAKIIEKEGGTATLKLTQEEALNVIFTANTLGGKVGSVSALQKMRSLLGVNSPEWAALKEEGFMKLISSQAKGGSRGVDMNRIISGDKLATAVDSSFSANKSLWTTLFTASDQALIQKIKRVALQATNRVPGSVNHSGSATEIIRHMNGLLGPGSKAIQFVIEKLGLPKAAGAVSATTATLGGLPRRALPAPGVAGGAVGVVGSPAANQLLQE